MRIRGPDVPVGKQLTDQTKPSPVSVKTQRVESRHDAPAARLAALFMDKGLDVPPSQLTALEAELSALGMHISELDGNSALRALVLSSHNIPLKPELLKNSWDQKPAFFERLYMLRDHARSLLTRKHLSGDMRTAVEVLVNDLDALLTVDESRAGMRLILEELVDMWVYELEQHLKGVVEGEIGSITELHGPLHDELRAIIDILRSIPEDEIARQTSQFADSLRDAVSELRARIQQYSPERMELTAYIREAVRLFGELLTVLAGALETFLTANTSQIVQTGLMSGFFQERVRELEHRLLTGFHDIRGERLSSTFPDGDTGPVSLMEALQKSGMAFEWRLLAWFRSNRDPARLHALIHEDLKGILLNFIGKAKKSGGKVRIISKLHHLEQEAQTVIDTITHCQLENILDDYVSTQGLYMEVPLGEKPDEGHAKIIARGNKEPGEKLLNPENLNISFSVETSKLGTVNVSLSFSGKSVALKFSLQNEEVHALAKEFGDDIRDSLTTRGFTVRSVELGMSKDETGSGTSSEQTTQPGNVDIFG